MNDLIQRQDAIDTLNREYTWHDDDDPNAFERIIGLVPSAGQNCVLCEYYTEIETDDGIKGKCTRRTMSDLISRQDAIDALTDFIWVDYPTRELAQESAEMVMGQAPSAEPKTGTWVLKPILPDSHRYMCSNCKSHHRERYNYCPNCGAKMGGEEE